MCLEAPDDMVLYYRAAAIAPLHIVYIFCTMYVEAYFWKSWIKGMPLKFDLFMFCFVKFMVFNFGGEL